MNTISVFDALSDVKAYYEKMRPATNVQNQTTMYIATDGEQLLILRSEPDQWNDGYLFQCETRDGQTYIELIN
jgi:hypothetical protein